MGYENVSFQKRLNSLKKDYLKNVQPYMRRLRQGGMSRGQRKKLKHLKAVRKWRRIQKIIDLRNEKERWYEVRSDYRGGKKERGGVKFESKDD